jgi:hypothetical protein
MSNTSSPARGLDSAIDLGVAALAAVSVGFVTFAMPENLFSSLISATHLPDLIAAAAPPLGMKARLAVVAADAVLTFALVWALLRAIGSRAEARPARRSEKKPFDAETPRVRRADAHPDAPARRPLFAGSDLGEPSEVYELDRAEPIHAEHVEHVDDDFGQSGDSQIDDDPRATESPEPVSEEPRKLPRFLVAQSAQAAAEEPIATPRRKPSFESLAAQLPARSEPSNSSIGSLMQRLERGLSEREEAPVQDQAHAGEEARLQPGPASPVEQEGPLSSDGVRHRLRSAISDMNQIAKRG